MHLGAPLHIMVSVSLCLTVWSHADVEHSMAIRRTPEVGHSSSHKELAQSLVFAYLKGLQADTQDPMYQTHCNHPSQPSQVYNHTQTSHS